MATEQIPDEANVQAFFERAVFGAIRFCGQSAYMFRFLLSPPSSLPKQIAGCDVRLAPPLSFLTVGVFVAGIVQRLSYAIDLGESFTAEAFAAEFHNAYNEISLWEVSLRTFPGVILIVLIGAIVAGVAKTPERFDRNPIVATTCYAAGLHSMVFGFTYFTILWINAFYSTEFGTVIGPPMREKLLTGAVVLTGVYSALVIAASIRLSAGRKLVGNPLASFPIGIVTTILLLSITYMSAQVSFDVGSAELRRNARFEQNYQNGFRVSIVETHSEPDLNSQLTQLHATLALTNLSSQRILVPRHRQLVTSDKQSVLRVVSNSIDLSQDKTLILEPNQTRVVQLMLDMSQLQTKLQSGQLSNRVLFPFHNTLNGYSYLPRNHYLELPLPVYNTGLGRGPGLTPAVMIGRPPETGIGSQLK